ncbi:MAG TPA: tetratricopeptide repeat protein, partial [Citricoccus sp.]
LQHRVRAHRLSPRPAEQDGLLAEVTDRGLAALERQDGLQAFEHFQHALWLRADTRMLTLALTAMVQARRPELVQGVRDPLRRLPPSRPRHAGQAWVWLATDNVEAALVHILSGLDLPEEDPDRSGLVLLAHALNATGHAALVKGRLELMEAPAQALLAQLRPLRIQLEHEARLDGGTRALLVEVQSLEAELALWSAGDHGDHIASGRHTSGMRMLLDELAAVPGTEAAQAGIGSVVGWGLLAQGEVAEAHRVLRGAAAADPADRTLSVRVHTGLGRLAFQAGDWDTAQTHFERAVENSLLLPTTAATRAAFASAALVPLARGDQPAGERLLARAQDEGLDAGDLVAGTVALARGIGALFTGEHRQAVRHFTVLDGGRPGLRTAGVTGMVLHARELALTGAADRLECLAASVGDDAAAAPPAVGRAVRDAVTGFLAVAHGELEQALRHLASCLGALDSAVESPTAAVRSAVSAAPLPGGGHALVRAFVALDAAGVAHQLPGTVAGDEQALGWVRQAAETFLRTDSRRQH